MNNQQLVELSEKVRDHLTKQKARAVADIPQEENTKFPGKVISRCRYRGDNGTMCAVGCLIPDERYTPSLEGFSAGHEAIMSAIFGGGVPDEYDAYKVERLLCNWQHYHDHGDYAPWCLGEGWANSPADRHQRALESGAFEVGV